MQVPNLPGSSRHPFWRRSILAWRRSILAWRRSPSFLAQVRKKVGDLRHQRPQRKDLRRRSPTKKRTCARKAGDLLHKCPGPAPGSRRRGCSPKPVAASGHPAGQIIKKKSRREGGGPQAERSGREGRSEGLGLQPLLRRKMQQIDYEKKLNLHRVTMEIQFW